MNRAIPLLRFQCKTDPMKKIIIELHYQEGGMSFLAGEVRKRGYTILVSPETFKESISSDGKKTIWKSFTAFQGTLDFVAPAARFSQIAMEKLAKEILATKRWQKAFNYVMQKNSLVLEDYEQETQ